MLNVINEDGDNIVGDERIICFILYPQEAGSLSLFILKLIFSI